MTYTVADICRVLKNGDAAKGKASCPVHDDDSPSLSVGAGRNGSAVVHCHAGCDQEVVWAAIKSRLSSNGKQNGNGRQPVATYTYTYADGSPESYRDRFEWVEKGKREKAVYPRQIDGTKKGAPSVPYRLHRIVKQIASGGLVILCEGEKVADALESQGFTATTTGAATSWKKKFANHFKGARVVLWADADASGEKYIADAAADLAPVVADLRTLCFEGRPEHWDAFDFFAEGGTADGLTALLENAPQYVATKRTRHHNEESHNGASDDDERAPMQDNEDGGDVQNAALLHRLHGKELRYVRQWGRWLVWQPARQCWTLDHGDIFVREMAKDVGRELRRCAAEMTNTAHAKKLFEHALRTQTAQKIAAMVNLARGLSGIPIEHEQLDADGWLLGVRNGVVNLRTGELRNAAPGDLVTMQCPVAYDPTATAPRWEMAMAQWFPDPETRSYVKRLDGMALIGAQREHVFPIDIGNGANGKGTHTRAILAAMGPYAAVIHLSLLVEQKHNEHDTVKANLFRKRLAVASETKGRARLDEASVKNLSGGDRITARRMREDPWEFTPSHTLRLQTNILPEVKGRDGGIWRRIRVVKWPSTFAGRDQDQDLDAKLADEAAGILKWLIDGCLEYQRTGLAEPNAVIRETLAYRASEDVLARFKADVGLEFGGAGQVPAGQLQTMLTDWAMDEGIEPPRKELKAWLAEQGVKQLNIWTSPDASGKKKRAKVYSGIGFALAKTNLGTDGTDSPSSPHSARAHREEQATSVPSVPSRVDSLQTDLTGVVVHDDGSQSFTPARSAALQAQRRAKMQAVQA